MIACILAVTAAFLARESQSLLTGEGVAPEVLAALRRMALAAQGVERLNEIRSMHFGPRDVLVVISLDFRNDLTAGQVEIVVSALERQIKQAYPEVTRVFIEAQDSHAQPTSATITLPRRGCLRRDEFVRPVALGEQQGAQRGVIDLIFNLAPYRRLGMEGNACPRHP